MYLIFIFIYALLIVTRTSLVELFYFLPVLMALILLLKPKRALFKHLGFLLGFEGLLFILALFTPGEPALKTPLGVVTYEGIQRFSLLLGKAFLSSSAVVVVSNSLGFPYILGEMESLGFPRILVLTLAFTYRYLELFEEEALRMRRALDSRAFNVGKIEYYRKLGTLIGEIFTRAYMRSVRIHWAMLSRGFGEFPKVNEERRLEPLILTLIALGVALL
ncbi:Transmembrane component NikQ of energizing module of nickel ECF transporter [Thermococcus sp. 2319x1]|uniref:energy-coupling factor transporter transmembrane component T family protein n=1 Tax=Thermococcus sp. 2319x1 TaxID=1674923 RepID=UPI00073AB307|nr:energy-coupling factor transporter transmembrane component T [Thermococcus sp. 2319x1]ALV62265.1 Transmembrane component NikQ of energizing module of nickel ECF transporter [Thermococcus sp. 2319x1]